MVKRLRMGLYSAQALLQISHEGFDIDSCDKDSPVETAFNSQWGKQSFANIFASGSVSLGENEYDSSGNTMRYFVFDYRGASVFSERPFQLYMVPYKNDKFYTLRYRRYRPNTIDQADNPSDDLTVFPELYATGPNSNASVGWANLIPLSTVVFTPHRVRNVIFNGSYTITPVYETGGNTNYFWFAYDVDYDGAPSW